jgi:hypothetical protein
MSEAKPFGPILRRTFGETAGLRVLSGAEERRRTRSRLAIASDIDRRLWALGYLRY